MNPTPVRRALAAVLYMAATPVLFAQLPINPRPTPFGLDVGGFYQALDNAYSDWRGIDVRLSYTGVRFSPFGGVSTQTRREGSQNSFGVGTYYTINKHFYSIAGFSSAFGGTTVLYPRFRWDASLFGDTGIPGLVLGAGYTHVSFDPGSTGAIISVGPILYRGPLILSGSLYLNHDGVGGANTGSGEIGGQYGAQGKQWIGARIAAGKEAYQLLAATPFDVQFTNTPARIFNATSAANRYPLLGHDYRHEVITMFRQAEPRDIAGIRPSYVLLSASQVPSFTAAEPMTLIERGPGLPGGDTLSLWRVGGADTLGVRPPDR